MNTTTYANETNPISDDVVATREAIDYSAPVDLSDPHLIRITRLRLLTDPGFPVWDLSYCYGELADGTPVYVNLPVRQFPRRNLKGALIKMCKDAGRYGKDLGILDPDVISQVW